MKSILAFGAIPFPKLVRSDLYSYRGIAKIRREVGGNTGNCIIGEYGRLGIEGVFTNMHFPNRYGGMTPEEANERFDHVVIFAANWISKEFNGDFSPDLEWFRRVTIPVTLIGLGQQVPENLTSREQIGSFLASLHPTFLDFFRLIASKSASVSVRGFRTKEILETMGITNVNATGCPTWYVNGTDQQDIVKTKAYGEDLKLVFHASPGLGRNTYRRMFELASGHADSSLMLQSEFFLAPYTGLRGAKANFLVKGRYVLDKAMVTRREWVRLYVSLESWERYLRTRDFSFGSRIHGTILALKNNVPAVVLTCDSRTREFVDILGIPSREYTDIYRKGHSLRQLYDEADFSVMNRRYSSLLLNYRDFLQCNGLTPQNRPSRVSATECHEENLDLPRIHYGKALGITARLFLERYLQKMQGKGVLSHAPVARAK